jgi:translation elongation factor EF-1beta
VIIYKITCLKNNKSYIGKSVKTFNERYLDGKFWSQTHNQDLQDDAYKYGSEFFNVKIILDSESVNEEDLATFENALIQKHGTMIPYGYNKKVDGQGFFKPRLFSKRNSSISIKHAPNSIEVRLDDIDDDIKMLSVENAFHGFCSQYGIGFGINFNNILNCLIDKEYLKFKIKFNDQEIEMIAFSKEKIKTKILI